MLTAAVTALTRTDDATGVVLVGGSLTLLSWLVTPLWLGGVLFVTPALAAVAPVALAPALVARGYFVRVTRGAIQDGDAASAPSLVAWGELARDGAKSAVLSAALLAPLVGGLAVAAGAGAALVAGPVDPTAVASAVESALGPSGPAAVAAVGAVLLAALVGAYLLAFAYLRPAALAAFAASGRLRDGLSPRTVADVAVSGSYATAWTLAVGVLAVGYAVAAPATPLVVGVALAFLVRVVAHGLYGRGAAAALAERSPEGAESPTEADVTDRTVATTAPNATREPAAVGEPVATRTPGAGRAPSTSGMSGDGGRPLRSEPPATVQVGRAVPVGDGGARVGGRGESDDRDNSNGEAGPTDDADPNSGASPTDEAEPDGGFEWGPPLDDAEDKS